MAFCSIPLLLFTKPSPCSPLKAEVKELVNGLGSNSSNNSSNSKSPKSGDDRGQPWEREKSVEDFLIGPVLCCAFHQDFTGTTWFLCLEQMDRFIKKNCSTKILDQNAAIHL